MTNYNKIIIIEDTVFREHNFRIFGVELLTQNGFNVEIWEITPVIHKQKMDKIYSEDRITYSKLRVFSNMSDLLKSISELEKTSLVHIIIPFNLHTLPIFQALSKKSITCFSTATAAIPIAANRRNNSRFTSLWGKCQNVFRYPPGRLFFTIVDRLLLKYYKFFKVAPIKICIAGGRTSLGFFQLPHDSTTDIVWGHSFDYDIYLELCKKIVPEEKNLGVFIDQNLPFHPEHFYCNNYPTCTPEEYYPALCKFFDYLEREHNINIVIAAHPTSNYNDVDFFGGRTVIYGKTGELIQKSSFVLTHGSTAISYAILFKKPLVFITNNKIQNSILQPDLEIMTDLLNKKPINVDQKYEFDWDIELAINQDLYDQFILAYYKTDGSAKIPLWQIFSNYIKNKENSDLL